MKHSNLPVSVYEDLFDAVERLKQEWRRSDLDDTFDSRIIDAVLRHLERYPAPVTMSATDLGRYARHLLRRFWKQNARRDHARLKLARAEGKRLEARSLHFICEETGREPATDLYAPLRHDVNAGELGRAVVQELITQGVAREWAWAFVWRACGRTMDNIAYLMEERFQCGPIPPATLNTWERHTYKAILAHVRRTFTEVDTRGIVGTNLIEDVHYDSDFGVAS